MSHQSPALNLPECRILTLMQEHIALRGGIRYTSVGDIPKDVKPKMDQIKAEIQALASQDEVLKVLAKHHVFNQHAVEDIVGTYGAFPTLTTVWALTRPTWRRVITFRNHIPLEERSFVSFISAFPIAQQASLLAINPKIGNFVVPDGYKVSLYGVIHEKSSVMLTNGTLFLLDVIVDQSTKLHNGVLCWYETASQQWRQETFPASILADAHKLPGILASYGLPVHSETARQIVTYISEWRTVNARFLQPLLITNKLGWLPNMEGFIYYPKNYGVTEGISLAPASGVASSLKAIRTMGTLEGWYTILRRCARYPVAYASIYASVSSLFLSIINEAEPFIFDLGWPSGSGKTTSLRLGISVFGDHTDSMGLFSTWKDTMVSRAAKMGFFNNLTFFCDETQHVRGSPSQLADMAYMTSGGQERSRGTASGNIIQAHTWRLIVFSTGESPLSEMIQEAGGQARVLNVTAPPFGQGASGKEDAEFVKSETLRHHGHLAPLVIQALIDKKDEWPIIIEFWRSRTQAYASQYSSLIKNNSILGRRLNHVALLDTVATFLHDVIGIPVPEGYTKLENGTAVNPAINMLLATLTRSVDSRAPQLKQFEKFRASLVNRKHHFQFYDSSDDASTPPRYGISWLGWWKAPGEVITPENDFVYIEIEQAKKLICEATGVTHPYSNIDSWSQLGYLDFVPNEMGEYERGASTHIITVGKIIHRCLRIARKKLYDPEAA